MTPPHDLATVDRATLEPLARVAASCPDLPIDIWETTPLSTQGRRHVVRLSGTGHDGLAPRSWSLILKVIAAPERADAPDTDPHSWIYWEREYLLYAAGVPQSLTGALRAPHCFGVSQPTPDRRWLWLEDLHDRHGRVWPLDAYALAARHLGAFNGAYLVGRRRPAAPSLGGDRLRSRSADMIMNPGRLRDPALWAHPRLRRAFPRAVHGDLERLLTERERYLSAAAQLPRTFCHLDAHQGNMAATVDAAGAPVTVLFDWAIAGYAPPGMELANLVWSSFLEFQIDVQQAAELEASVIDSYLQGLAEVGCRVEPRLVRCAYLIGSVLLFGLLPEAVEHALNEDHKGLERYYGWPLDRLVAQAAEVTYLLLERADELRGLLVTR